ncbi:MAG TPA: hypothetical protein VGF99_07045, partial [Myxococcota bacterium]
MSLIPKNLHAALRPSSTAARAKTAKTGAAAARAERAKADGAAAADAAGYDDVDRFEKDDGGTPRPKLASLSTKRTGFSASAVFLGAEFAVKVNHVDPLNEGRKDVKLAWVADGEHGSVDVETILLRRNLGTNSRFELQGPALTAKAADGGLPLKTRFFGVGLTGQLGDEMPHDTTPPRVEVKVEVKLTDKSVGSLAALAGCTQELTNLTAELAGSEVGKALGTALVGAIPVVSGAVAVVSAKRAYEALRDPDGSFTTRSLAVARALADATTVVLPLIGTIANIGI